MAIEATGPHTAEAPSEIPTTRSSGARRRAGGSAASGRQRGYPCPYNVSNPGIVRKPRVCPEAERLRSPTGCGRRGATPRAGMPATPDRSRARQARSRDPRGLRPRCLSTHRDRPSASLPPACPRRRPPGRRWYVSRKSFDRKPCAVQPGPHEIWMSRHCSGDEGTG